MIDLSDKSNVEKLIKGCIKGERKSQKILYQTFYGKMLGVCARYARDIDEAQDILHDGYIKVFTKLERFEYKGSFEGWIRRIIVNNAIDYLRNRRDYFIESENDRGMEDLRDDSYDDLDYEQMVKLKAETVIQLIQKLTPAYRTVFNMYILDEMSHKEIAESLNISVGTSKSNLAKAKQKLKELFNEYTDKIEE